MLEALVNLLLLGSGLAAVGGITYALLCICLELANSDYSDSDKFDRRIGLGFAVGIASGAVFLVALVIGLVLFGSSGDAHLIPGHCYEAVRTESNGLMPISTGKTVIMVPTHTEGVALQETTCK